MSNKPNNQRSQMDDNNPLTPENLLKNLMRTTVPMSSAGAIFKASCYKLGTQLASAIATGCEIRELNRVFIYPESDDRDLTKCSLVAFMYFDIGRGLKNPDICINGSQSNNIGGKRSLLKYSNNVRGSVRYWMSEKFKEHIMAFDPEMDNDGNIIVRKAPQTRNQVVCIRVSPLLLIAMALGITENSPYNFTILHVDRGPTNPDNEMDDVTLHINKYIDVRGYKKDSGNGRKFDFRTADREMLAMSRRSGY